jgi:hypothetical protein
VLYAAIAALKLPAAMASPPCCIAWRAASSAVACPRICPHSPLASAIARQQIDVCMSSRMERPDRPPARQARRRTPAPAPLIPEQSAHRRHRFPSLFVLRVMGKYRASPNCERSMRQFSARDPGRRNSSNEIQAPPINRCKGINGLAARYEA